MHSQFLDYLSAFLGWTYVLMWGISFYPTIWTIYKLKSAEGVKCDYQMLNISGYIFLSAYSTAGYFNPSVDVGTVDLEDLVFCYHGFILTSITIGLLIYYPRGKNHISKIFLIENILLWVITILYFLLTYFELIEKILNRNIWQIMGYNKLVISLTKYIPQVVWNYKRKSTVGWSIYATLLDLSGGILSLIQSIIDKINNDATINAVKFILGFITLVFDFIMTFQHYVLYPENNYNKVKVANEEEPYSDVNYLSLPPGNNSTIKMQ